MAVQRATSPSWYHLWVAVSQALQERFIDILLHSKRSWCTGLPTTARGKAPSKIKSRHVTSSKGRSIASTPRILLRVQVQG